MSFDLSSGTVGLAAPNIATGNAFDAIAIVARIKAPILVNGVTIVNITDEQGPPLPAFATLETKSFGNFGAKQGTATYELNGGYLELPLNVWSVVAAIFPPDALGGTPGWITCYCNNDLDSTNRYPGISNDLLWPLGKGPVQYGIGIGANVSNASAVTVSGFRALVDEVAILARYPTEAELDQFYAGGAGGTGMRANSVWSTGLRHHWYGNNKTCRISGAVLADYGGTVSISGDNPSVNELTRSHAITLDESCRGRSVVAKVTDGNDLDTALSEIAEWAGVVPAGSGSYTLKIPAASLTVGSVRMALVFEGAAGAINWSTAKNLGMARATVIEE